MAVTPYPQQITARITYTPTVNLPPSSLKRLFELRLPIIEDLTPDNVKVSTIPVLRKYLLLYRKLCSQSIPYKCPYLIFIEECTSTLRRPYSKLEFVRYFNRIFECRPCEIPTDDGIHQSIRELVGSAILTEQALLLGSRVKNVARYLSAETWDGNPDEAFMRFAESLASVANENNTSESCTDIFGTLSGFEKTRCLKLARGSYSTGCAGFDRIEIYKS